MPMRPPRSKKRFQGEGTTSLSNPYHDGEVDGTKMRRRYAMFGAACLLVVALIIGLAVSGSKKNKNQGGTVQSSNVKVDEVYSQESSSTIEGVASDVKIYKHKKSGLQVMTVVPEDTTQDATFGINFRTLPTNDRGTPMVLENCMLTGSRRYPIKDPFNQLRRGSLQTYLDSWTNRDRTSFVFSTRNKQDYINGMNVILDTVFDPLIVDASHVWAFRQEGWRLEGGSMENMYLTGNAINQARAAQMKPTDAVISYVYKNLFDQSTYGHKFEGRMEDIVTLTHTELVEFYIKYYQPANGQAFCYGPQDFVDECLKLLDPVLQDYKRDEKVREATTVPWQNLDRIMTSYDRIPYPSYEGSTDSRLVKAFVLNDQMMDARTEVAWMLIYELLLGSPTASISKLLSSQNIGDDSIGILDTSIQQWVLVMGVSGVLDSTTIQKAQDAISNKLVEHAENGFAKEDLEPALNKLEMRFRDPSSEDMPQGAKMFQTVLSHWNYDRDPKTPLNYPKDLALLKEELLGDAGQKYIMDLITRKLLDNRHQCTVELFPSSSLLSAYRKQEQQWLDNLPQFITEAQGKQIVREGKDMKAIQESNDPEEVLAMIPRVKIADLNPLIEEIPMEIEKDLHDSGIKLLKHTLPNTNGIAYVDFAIDVSNVDFDDVVLIPLLCQLMIYSGTSRKTETEFQRQVDSQTGGFLVYPLIEDIFDASDKGYVIPDGEHMVTKIVIRSSCVAKTNCIEMFQLIKHAIFDTDLEDKNMVQVMLEKMIDDMEDDLQMNGHKFTTLRIASEFSIPGFVNEQWQGITQLLNLRRAYAEAKSDFDALSMRLLLMQDAIKRGHRNGMLFSLTGDAQALADIYGGVQVFVRDSIPGATQVSKFPNFATTTHPWVAKGKKRMQDELKKEGRSEAFLVPTLVNHVGKGGILYDVGEAFTGADEVVMQYLSGYYLFDKLRFALGAKEGRAVLDFDSGAVIYQSDEDPSILETLAIFEKGASWLWDETKDRKTLPHEAEGAIVGAIGTLDGTAVQPSLAGYISMKRYLKGDTPEIRQLFRDQVLNAKVEDFTRMVERLGAWGKPTVAVVTNLEELKVVRESGWNITTCDVTGYTC